MGAFNCRPRRDSRLDRLALNVARFRPLGCGARAPTGAVLPPRPELAERAAADLAAEAVAADAVAAETLAAEGVRRMARITRCVLAVLRA